MEFGLFSLGIQVVIPQFCSLFLKCMCKNTVSTDYGKWTLQSVSLNS